MTKCSKCNDHESSLLCDNMCEICHEVNIINTIYASQNKPKTNDEENLKKTKAELIDKYIVLIDKESVINKKHNPILLGKCPECNIDRTLVQDENILICQNCGQAEIIITCNVEQSNHKNITPDTKSKYTRINNHPFTISANNTNNNP